MTLISLTADFWFFAVFSFLFGLVFGSFLNVCIYRLPLGLSVIAPRSACPGCHAPIAAYDNIPVISWWLLGGKCRSCQQPISARYWVIELITGLMFISCFLRFGFDLATLKFWTFSFLVLGLIFTDADSQLLPDSLTLPGIGIGLLWVPLVPVSGVAGWLQMMTQTPAVDWRLASSINAVAGMLLGAGFIYGMGEFWFRFRGIEAMGLGDVKLMAMVGAFLGPTLTLMTIFLGSLFGSAVGVTLAWLAYKKRMGRWKGSARAHARAKAQHAVAAVMRRFPVPFGIFLGMGALISAFFGEWLISAYLGLFR